MPRVVLYVLPVVLLVYAFVDCVLDRGRPAPFAPRWIWLIAIVIAPVVGPLGWLIVAHVIAPPVAAKPRTRMRAPDDDPDFLRGLRPDDKNKPRGEDPS